MDNKVMELLIERIVESSRNYELHKNDAWKECLESDKERLKKFIEKYVFEPEPDEPKLPDNFKFTYEDNMNIIYRAVRESEGYFTVYWDDESKVKSRRYLERVVVDSLERNIWKFVD